MKALRHLRVLERLVWAKHPPIKMRVRTLVLTLYDPGHTNVWLNRVVGARYTTVTVCANRQSGQYAVRHSANEQIEVTIGKPTTEQLFEKAVGRQALQRDVNGSVASVEVVTTPNTRVVIRQPATINLHV